MPGTKRYYWMRFGKNFFQEHEIRIIESMPNGAKYVLFYIKLLAESVSHDGRLRCSDAIPYNEQMLAGITNTDPDVVHSAMQVLTQLGLVEILDDETLYMTKVSELIGSETEDAARKRISRAKADNVRTMSENVRTMSGKRPAENRESLSIKDISHHNASAGAREENAGENVENVENFDADPNRPELENVIEYIRNNGLIVDPKKFMEYYDEAGWPFDWMAKARTWDSYYSKTPAGKREKYGFL